MSEASTPETPAAVTWVATAVVVGGLVAGAVLVERAFTRTWKRMRENIHPLAPAAASLQRTRATYRRRAGHVTDAGGVIGELIRMAPRSR